MYLYDKMEENLALKREVAIFRTLQVNSQEQQFIKVQDSNLINLSSNDYLGIARDRQLVAEFLENNTKNRDFYFSSSSSRLLTGTFDAYDKCEEAFSKSFSKSALYLNSGYSGNSGIIASLFDKNTLLLIDKLCHFSILNGVLMSKAKHMRFSHNDLEHLRILLKAYYDKYKAVVIITESLFSMDGDFAIMKALVNLKKEYKNLYLYIDEAHSFFLYGQGLGWAKELNLLESVDFLLLTLGKAFGSTGSIFLCNKITRDYLINNLSSFIYSTALAPVNVLFSLFIFSKNQEFTKRRERLKKIAAYLRSIVASKGFCCLSSSHIIPLVYKNNELMFKASEMFLNHNFYCRGIRYPTVPKDSPRLRLSICNFLSDDNVDQLGRLIKNI